MTARRFTDAEEHEIRKLYEIGGFTCRQIARVYHTNPNTVAMSVKRAGGHCRSRGESRRLSTERGRYKPLKRFTDAEEQEIWKVYSVGKFSTTQIAEYYHCSHHAVRYAIVSAGGHVRSLSEARKLSLTKGKNRGEMRFTDAEARELEKVFEVGQFSPPQIARAYQVGSTTIRRTIERAGGSLRTRADARCLTFPEVDVYDSAGYPQRGIRFLTGEALALARAMMPQRGNVSCHRLVMALHLGRPLDSKEIVHHRDGNKNNYHLDNLELLTVNSHHCGHGSPYYQQLQEALAKVERLERLLESAAIEGA